MRFGEMQFEFRCEHIRQARASPSADWDCGLFFVRIVYILFSTILSSEKSEPLSLDRRWQQSPTTAARATARHPAAATAHGGAVRGGAAMLYFSRLRGGTSGLLPTCAGAPHSSGRGTMHRQSIVADRKPTWMLTTQHHQRLEERHSEHHSRCRGRRRMRPRRPRASPVFSACQGAG